MSLVLVDILFMCVAMGLDPGLHCQMLSLTSCNTQQTRRSSPPRRKKPPLFEPIGGDIFSGNLCAQAACVFGSQVKEKKRSATKVRPDQQTCLRRPVAEICLCIPRRVPARTPVTTATLRRLRRLDAIAIEMVEIVGMVVRATAIGTPRPPRRCFPRRPPTPFGP